MAYNIIYDYNILNNIRGYGVLKHLIGCLGAYALWYYHKLEVVYNKYYLKHTMTVSHKPIFVMARRDPILNMIEKKNALKVNSDDDINDFLTLTTTLDPRF